MNCLITLKLYGARDIVLSLPLIVNNIAGEFQNE